MFDIVTLGELLIDFTAAGLSPDGMRLFEQNPGGAVANVACALSSLGGKAAFIGKVGSDMHGSFLEQTLREKSVDTTGLMVDSSVFTTLAFVALGVGGEREFSFARKPGADTCLRPDEIDYSLIENTKVFHIGSLSLTAEPARSSTYAATERARKAGVIISYDPNYRASLWQNKQSAINEMRGILPFVDIMKLSDEETELLTDIASPEGASEALVDMGIKCVAVTLGEKGAFIRTKGGSSIVEGFSMQATDTTGAGDAFWGGFLYSFIKGGKRLGELTISDAMSYSLTGNAAAALCITKRGGIPAMPDLGAVEQLLSTRS